MQNLKNHEFINIYKQNDFMVSGRKVIINAKFKVCKCCGISEIDEECRRKMLKVLRINKN